MQYTAEEVLRFVEENDVKFVRLAFCDLAGAQRNMAIMAENLEKAFARGVRFDAGAVIGALPEGESDLLLFPEPETLAVLPWRPQQGRVARLFCRLCRRDGTPFEGDARRLLQWTAEEAAAEGFTFGVGQECEFYLFRTEEDGQPSRIPYDEAGYLDVAPLDKGENIRRDICLTLGEMDVTPESSHHERGPGQNEVSFRHSEPLTAADHMLTFKGVVRSMAARGGLHASFMPKPIADAPGSGMRYYLTVHYEGKNIFDAPEYATLAENFAAGIKQRLRETALFLNPLSNSYRRLAETRARKVRLCSALGRDTRLEICSADPAINPYLTLMLLLRAGLDGIRMKISDPGEPELPDNLGEAITAAQESAFIVRTLPALVTREYLDTASRRWAEHRVAANPFEDDVATYFRKI